ncbi:unnamed protein product [Blepharisma stoltei]|uniref:Uncharacterized protein n=1 Tax=Blepharisma stoltei TaxID=1481888 RepID=A0AAU9IBC7_9CILI|nr:unnamed protein product [Blepharisma stoltei]
MRSKTAPSDTHNNIRKHLSKIREIRSEIEKVPDDYTPHVTAWRSSIDTLQRELELQLSYITSLRATTEDPEKQKELNFRESLYEIIKEMGEEFRNLVQILKPLVHIPKTCEFKNWDMITLDLRTELSKAAIAAEREGPEKTLEVLKEVYAYRDQLISQIIYSLLHKKIVLWMDLGIQQEEYVKGEVLVATQSILKYQEENGHIPTKIEYKHPRNTSEEETGYVPNLLSSITAFSEEFMSISRMLENSFSLLSKNNKIGTAVISLREEIEFVKKEAAKYEKELQSARSLLKSPDRREWVQINRELQQTHEQLENANMNIQRLNMEKINLEASNNELSQNMREMESRLKKLNDSVFPRLDELERLQGEIIAELKKIRQDADLLPEMFRSEVKLKKLIRDEKLQAEEKMKQAYEELFVIKSNRGKLENERDRKEKIAMQAIAARNLLDERLKEMQSSMGGVEKNLKESKELNEKLKHELDSYKEQFKELEEHVYVMNNRINELEDQKKSLIDQLKTLGAQSKAHYTYRRLKDES